MKKSFLYLLAILVLANNVYAANIQKFNGMTFANPAELNQINHEQFILGAVETIGRPEFTGTSYGMSGVTAASQHYFQPYFRYATRLNKLSDRWVFGFDITRPFASDQHWGNSSIVRYATTQHTWESVDFAPNLSIRLHKQLFIGAGYDALYLTYISNMMKKLARGDGLLVRHYNSWGYGWHAGLLFKLNSLTDLGLTYYSAISENLRGFSSLPGTTTTGSTLSIRLPEAAILTLRHKVNAKWTTIGMASYTWWHFYTFNYENTAVGNSQTPYHFRNTVRLAWDNHYAVNDKYTVNGGLSWDQGPTNHHDRTINTATVNTIGIILGVHYQINHPVGLDFNYGYSRYAHLASINSIRTKSFGHESSYNHSVEGRITWAV